LLGEALVKQNRTDEAIRNLSGLVFRFPKTEEAAQAIEQQALLYLKAKNSSEAQALYDRLLERYPESPTTARVWSAEADALFASEEFGKAFSIYQKIEKLLPPKSIEKLEVTRILAEGDGDPQKILPIAEKALNENNTALAKTLYEQLSKSSKIGSSLPQIQTKLGWCLLLEGGEENQARAERLWRGVIHSTQPTDRWYAESRWHLVQLAAGPKRDWKEAVSICDQIVKEQLVGTFPHEQALFSKAWLLTVHDQGKSAVAAFEDLAADYPKKMQQPPIQRHLERAVASAAKKSGGSR